MFSKAAVEMTNADLAKCLLNSAIIDFEFFNGLKNLSAKDANFTLLKFLRTFSDKEKIASILGMDILEENFTRSQEAIDFFGEKFAIADSVIPVAVGDDGLIIAVVDPFNVKLMDRLLLKFSLPISFKLASLEQMERFWEKILPPEEVLPAESESASISEGKESELVPLDRFFENLMEEAIRERASDVHLENICDGMRLRIRVDGKLHTLQTIDRVLAQAVVAKIKIKSNAKVDEVRLPQDKRIRAKVFDRNYDLRISILPTIYGENIAIRIFDQEENDFSLETIGLFPEQRKFMDSMINSRNGLVLLCGPTGCGKTTTLYTILKKISSPEKKVVTIEDPIEYRLDGINQVPVDDEIGLSFVSILRSVLRQSPNVIMIGEVRDRETAELAIQAALTGHLVFSTLHCNNSAGSITRLLDFKISEHLIKSCLRGAISQKLLRKPCQSCMTLRELSQREHAIFPQLSEAVRAVPELHGCAQCSRRGYMGRISAFDFLINKSLVSSCQADENDSVFDDFIHCETFASSAVKLLKSDCAVFEDVCQLLLL
ncbi:MAG: GspE/PulE family protein [Puniceicoccales bacterium]|jgi:type IV pilus assembly protein PilB|nr:GspE/PulE family protein [Puniceicoccales bacterium]